MALSIDRAPTLHQIADGVWTVDVGCRSFPLRDMPLRMTLIKSERGIVAHSPVLLDDAMWARIASDVGEVTHVVAPNEAHHQALVPFFARCRSSLSEPQLWLAPQLSKKLRASAVARALPLDAAKTIGEGEEIAFADAVDWIHLAGVPGLNEIVFFHRKSKTLIVTDAIVNVESHSHFVTRSLFKMIQAYGGPKQPMLWRLRAKDKAILLNAVHRVLAWPFERVICAHGDVMETGGRAAFKRVFEWAGADSGDVINEENP